MKIILLSILLVFASLRLAAQPDLNETFQAGVDGIKSRNFENAETQFTEVLKWTDDARARKMSYIYRAMAKDGLGKFPEALLDLDSAIAIDPSDLPTYFDQLNLFVKTFDYDGILRVCKIIESYHPSIQQAAMGHYFRGRACFGQGDFEAAVIEFSISLLEYPEDLTALFFRASAYEKLLKMEEAIADYDAMIRLNPVLPEPYANRGVLKINLLTMKGNLKPSKKETKGACEDLRKAKSMGDNSVDDMLEIYCK